MGANNETRLANPGLDERGEKEEGEKWQRKRGEDKEGLGRAEALWVAALEKLDAAEAKR